jgi:hypothetical protein
MRASSEPSAATAAPIRTTGASQPAPAASTAFDRVRQRRGGVGQGAWPQRQERGDGDDRVDKQGDGERDGDGAADGARGIADFLAERGDARVSGEGEEQQAGGAQDAAEARVVSDVEPCGLRWARGEGDDDDGGEHREHDRDDRAGQPRRLSHAGVVHRRQHHDGRDRHQSGLTRPHIGPDDECHGRARRCLADDESPAGQVSPEGAEAFAAVHVRAAGGRVARREPRG